MVIGESQGMGPAWTPGQLGIAVTLGGLDWVETPNSTAIDLRNDVTVELSFRVDRFANTWMPLLYKGTGFGARTYSMWLNSNGSLHLSTWDNASNEYISTAAGSIKAGEWYHVAGVLDRTNGQMRIVLDGADAASGSLRSAPSSAAGGALLLGKTPESSGDYAQFEGAIDDVRIWNVARPTTAIAAGRRAELAGTEAGLTFYLSLDENAGLTATDRVSGLATSQLRSLVEGAEGVIAGRVGQPGQMVHYTFALAEARRLYFDTLSDSNLQWSCPARTERSFPTVRCVTRTAPMPRHSSIWARASTR